MVEYYESLALKIPLGLEWSTKGGIHGCMECLIALFRVSTSKKV